MKRKDLIALLKEHGAVFVREGGSHSVYMNPRTGVNLIIPRHTEISEGVARDVVRNARRS